MNLTRMRKALFKNDLVTRKMTWSEMLLPLYQKYRYDLAWGEQDLLNIIFHYNPGNRASFYTYAAYGVTMFGHFRVSIAQKRLTHGVI